MGGQAPPQLIQRYRKAPAGQEGHQVEPALELGDRVGHGCRAGGRSRPIPDGAGRSEGSGNIGGRCDGGARGSASCGHYPVPGAGEVGVQGQRVGDPLPVRHLEAGAVHQGKTPAVGSDHAVEGLSVERVADPVHGEEGDEVDGEVTHRPEAAGSGFGS